MKRINNKKNLYKSLFLLAILIIGIGYAYLTSNLSITGSTEVVANTWDIHFENLQVSEGSVIATSPAIINSNNTSINYAVTLSRPKDFYEFTVDVKNDGTLPGKVSISTLSGLDTTSSKVIDYTVTYMNDRDVSIDDILNPTSTKTVKVRVYYKDDITEDDFPENNLNLNLTYTLQYVQSDEYNITGNLMNDVCGNATVFGRSMYKNEFERMELVDYSEVPSGVIASWDASVQHNGSIMAWYTDVDSDGKYELYIGQEGGVVPLPNSYCTFSYFYNVNYFDVSKLITSNVASMERLFYYNGSQANGTYEIVGLDKWDTSKVQSMSGMFEKTGSWYAEYYKVDVSNFDTSNVSDMSNMFYQAGNQSRKWEIGTLSSWDTRKVTNMKSMFRESATVAEEVCDIGSLDVYANNIELLFYSNACIKNNLNIYNSVTSYNQIFEKTSTINGSSVTVNYSSLVTNIDNIIATKSSNSNIIKGSLISN